MKKYCFLLLLSLFFLNTASHDFFCHEEIDGLCSPLHAGALAALDGPPPGIPAGTPLVAVLDWTPGETVIPGYISDIFHPPDFASRP